MASTRVAPRLLGLAALIAPVLASTACSLLQNTFPDTTLLSNETGYTEAYTHSWSKTCVIPPDCVFEPATAEDVSAALKFLERTNTSFAVRSGGHMPVPGAASIQDGVLISMSSLTSIDLNADHSEVTIGSGLRWIQVYETLANYNVAVAGGRFADVGVGGLLLGGGVNHFGSEVGWGANQVVRYEIVLAGGIIKNVTSSSDPDLFWALKGGLNNFGIVTRFTMKTIPITTVYGGLQIYQIPNYNDFVNALAHYADPSGGMTDIHSAIEPAIVFQPSVGLVAGGTTLFHRGNDTAPWSLANFTAIPVLESDVSLRSAYWTIANETSDPTWNSYENRQLYHSITLKARKESIYLVNETFTPLVMLNETLKKVPGFQVSLTHQPISQAWLEAARASGGDAMDLDPALGPIDALGISSFWSNAEDDQTIFDFHVLAVEALTAAAKEADLYYDFIYSNDAHPSQNVFSTYGYGKSLQKLKQVSRRYDPKGVFQKLQNPVWAVRSCS